MTALREPDLGPIIGYTTDTTCRIWIRGADPDDRGVILSPNRRTVGVIALTEVNGKAIKNPDVFYFRLHRKYDRTGTFMLGEDSCIITKNKSQPLKPNTAYTARVGTLSLDDPYDDDMNVSDKVLADSLSEAKVWWYGLLALREDRSTATFRTFAAEDNRPGKLSFILGSCRYPGFLGKIKEADEIFGPLLQEAEGKGSSSSSQRTEFVLMVGDQIYADKLTPDIPVGRADTPQEFQDRYHEAFGCRNMRELLSKEPTYMILDDHEIEDNWTWYHIEKCDKRPLFNCAIGAYLSYQWSHSPRTFQQPLYYFFECNGYPFFVLDTRTQRYMDEEAEDLSNNHLLGRPALSDDEPSQLDRLLRWLVMQQEGRGNTPKFIVTPSAFVPNTLDARESRGSRYVSKKTKAKWKMDSDSWPAFPETRRAILNCIIENEIQNVVFLSGDIHCSNVAELKFSGSKKARMLKAFSVTSSAFYWPFCFADGEPSSFVHVSKDKKQADTFKIDYKHKLDYKAWNFTQEDNFCRIDVNAAAHTLTVTAMDRKGEVIHKKDWLGRSTDEEIITELVFASGW